MGENGRFGGVGRGEDVSVELGYFRHASKPVRRGTYATEECLSLCVCVSLPFYVLPLLS